MEPTRATRPHALAARGDAEVIDALRAGDEATFRALVDLHSPALLRVAMASVPSRAVAEEVVQETWIAVIRGLDGFERRSRPGSSAANLALKGGGRERRSVPFSALATGDDPDAPSVDPDRFLPADHARFPGHWALGPTRWPTPEQGLLAGETRAVIVSAIDALPEAQRTVIALRDVEGWPAEDVCEALGISPGNQRVLLDRARARARAAVERHYGAVERTEGEGAVTPRPLGGTTQQPMEPGP